MPTLPPAGTLVLLHGLGRFGGGREALRFLARHGCRVRVSDRSASEDLQAVRNAMVDVGDVDWQLGREDEALLDGVELFVTNPAIPDQHALLAAARAQNIAVTQEVDLFLAAYPGRVVAITGTNGKSTTSTLLHRALSQSGCPALLGGNIGHSLLADEASWHQGQVAVLEISSFQLDRLAMNQRVAGAVFTRIGKDHLDRHGSVAAYHAAKGRLAAIATDFVVHAADDAIAEGYPTSALHRFRYAATSPAPHSAGLFDGFVALRLGRGAPESIVHTAALRLLGDFQVENVMAASLAARHLGASPHEIGMAMANAAPLPFRLQLVATRNGVRIYDNGVSTEIESTLAAVRTLGGRLRWIGGGKSKDGDYATVATSLTPYLTSAHLFGAAAGPLAHAIAGRVPTTTDDRLPEALRQAWALARPGDAILFSPAFASFDQYPNFRARALEFHALLGALGADGAASG